MSEDSESNKTEIVLYGHPFSSYTWKALIALYAEDLEFDFRIVDGDHPEHVELVQSTSPMGKFPILVDGENMLFEATTIVEYIANHYGTLQMLIPKETDGAIGMRMLDRVFDNYVMMPMQAVVEEYLRDRDNPDLARVDAAKEQLDKAYRWIEGWLRYYPPMEHITLIECAAGPSLFYADWVHPIADDYPRLQQWREHLLRLPEIARCVEGARPYRSNFPLGDPGRD